MSTTITPQQMEGYRRGARERLARERQATATRREQALQAAEAAARLLKDEYSATRVVVYGSVLDAERFSLRSDIDLAAQGIPPADYWRAWGAVEQLAPEFEINLLALETARDSLLAHIDAYGLEL
jgi:predicted nucleotidyltransferase